MKKRKIKKNLFYVIIIVICAIIFGITSIKNYMYKQTDEYKFISLGYSEEETDFLLEYEEKTEYFIELGYSENLIDILNQRYYIDEFLESYLSYSQEFVDLDTKDVITAINIGIDKEFYTETQLTDSSLGNLMLLNKFNYLPEDYVPEVVSIPLTYAYDDNYLTQDAKDAYVNMASAALSEGIQLIAFSTYRSYEEQETLYNRYKTSYGLAFAEEYSARAGFSEHQTGLAVDITTPGYSMDTFDESDSYSWLISNCYKYGYILRYPENSEHLTGYSYESWHYRYVGVDVATKIYNEGITFDEYYAYYINNN
ncbi:MAG: M15 family metallopeptidase [Mycoplasmatota bacterium]